MGLAGPGTVRDSHWKQQLLREGLLSMRRGALESKSAW